MTYDDDRLRIPTWNGNPQTFRQYEQDVKIWLMGTKLDVDYSIAARLVSRLSGSAARTARRMAEVDLMPTRPADPAVPATREQLMKGVNNLLDKLRELAPQKEAYRGELMKEFFKEDKLKRRAGERITDWSIRWHESAELLEQNGVDLLANKSIASWYFLQHAALGEQRLEMIRAQLSGADSQIIRKLEETIARLFPNVHLMDRRSVGPQRRYAYEAGVDHDEYEETPGSGSWRR